MSDFDVKEKRFEEDIEDYLTHHGGYTKGDPKKFNRESGLEEDTFVEFIKTSQPKKWERYVKIYAENSEKQIIERFKREVKTTNLLNVMRHGFMDRGIKFYPIFWKPETSLNETTQMQYDANILHCTRQLHYSVHNENSIDIVLFANGIPVVSMELKCQFTGQDTTNAINQYKFDRAGKDAIFAFKERVLVHFAVDLTNVYMTTRLEGAHTYFLPFNQGSNGAGKVGGKGNPVNPNGYDTAYLWERVLCKDSLMEILQKYMHLQQEYDKNGNLVKETMIFPRYHQLDVVTKLLEDVKKNGSGKSYLIQHSAGSGKSNSIAWLAHRLTGLHDYEDNKIFQSVIIVTDRRVLDSQLQSTVYQFDHVEGVVKKVDKNSGQLRDAINDGVGIIITTLQKFPVIYKEVDSAKKRFAIIIDEAHSSQTGDAAKKLKRALADTEEILKEYAEMEDEDERNRKDDEDKLLDELAAQGMHKNLSFFAFTATPKGKTLQLFGQKDAEGIYRPFHIYSMRQAIEEHFILDVLQNYMTYKMYYKIAKIIEDNPEFDTTAGSKAIINYETLHPHNISQKTAIMLEHFMNVTRHKIGGRAKAMVVTPSRLHAVRYVQEFKRQIKEKGLNDLEVLVAFSGEVKDNDDVFTEEGMNKDKEGKTIKEKALPETFHADDYGILVVAEKYQTGFDEPLLHTMFVDKKLSGVKAVQTLSRLNRTTRGKVDTFVLDFVNSAEDIKASFEPFYEETVLLEETDPNVVYDMKNTLDDFRVYQKSEVDKFADIFYQNENQSAGDLGKLQGQLRPAIDRYEVLEVEKQDIFKKYRFVVMSRNLTFDRSWDISFAMDSSKNVRQKKKTQPICDFLDYLVMNVHNTSNNAGKKRNLIRGLCADIKDVSFSLDSKIFGEDFEVLPLGIGKNAYRMQEDILFCKERGNANSTFNELVVMSPFLSESVIADFNLTDRALSDCKRTLVTRRSELGKLKASDVDNFTIYALKDEIIDGEEEISDELADKKKQDIHAKIYLRRKYSDVDLYLGSMNASYSAINKNVEMMLWLGTKNMYLNGDKFLEDIFCGPVGDAKNPFEQVTVADAVLETESDNRNLLEQKIKDLCRVKRQAVISEDNENAGKYKIEVEFSGIESDSEVTVSPFNSKQEQTLSEHIEFSELEILQLSEFYEITARSGDDTIRRIIMIPTSGFPDDRESAAVNSVVKDRASFVEYIAFVLGDDYVASMLEGKQMGESGFFANSSDAMPALYEKMLKTSVEGPERIKDIICL